MRGTLTDWIERTSGALFPKKPLAEYTGAELTIATLGLMATGVFLVSLIAAPGLGIVYKHFNTKTKNQRYRLYQKIKRLETTGLIEKAGKWYQPTKKGERVLIERLLRTKPRANARWNGQWHYVMFDLPAAHMSARFDLTRFLYDLGYVQYQLSVYVHRFDLRHSVEEFSDLYGVRDYVRFVTASDVSDAGWLKKATERWAAPRRQRGRAEYSRS